MLDKGFIRELTSLATILVTDAFSTILRLLREELEEASWLI